MARLVQDLTLPCGCRIPPNLIGQVGVVTGEEGDSIIYCSRHDGSVNADLLAALEAVSQAMHEARQRRKPLSVSADDVAFVDAAIAKAKENTDE